MSMYRCGCTLQNPAFVALQNMRQNAELCDVKIALKNHCISAHRVVLAASIPFFRTMFASGLKECQEERVALSEIDSESLESLINYAYGKELKFTDENVQSLFLASDYLDILHVKNACGRFMASRLNIKNVLEVRNFAEHLTHESLIHKCNQYLFENLKDFSKSEHFRRLPFSVLKAILGSRSLLWKHISEKTVFETIIAWIKASEATDAERQGMISELFWLIELDDLSFDYLCNRIASEEMIESSDICRELVEEVKASHSYGMTKWHSKVRCNGSGVYAVCFSESIGLYVRIYDLHDKKWVRLAQGFPMESGFEHVVSRLDEIYICGLKTCATFKLNSLEWVKCQNPSLIFHRTLKHRDKVFLFDDNPFSSNESLKCMEDSFRKMFPKRDGSSVPDREAKKVTWPSFACLKNYIYVCGGQSEGKCINTFERCNWTTDTWAELPPMITKRYGHISAAVNNTIYVCGGMNDSQENINTVEAFSIDTDQWLTLLSMKMPRSRFSLTAWDGKLYAVGGTKKSGSKYSVEIFDPNTNEWKYGTPICVWDVKGKTMVKVTSFCEGGNVQKNFA